MPDVYFATDVLAVTSDNEGTAVTAIEAQAAGVPVVTTRVGGMTSVVRDGETGFVIPTTAEGALARRITELLLDEQSRAHIGEAGRAFVLAAFLLERLVNDLDELYTRNLSGGISAKAQLTG